ncbi:MAG: hypothetical protein UU67_C0031G0011 [Candidatus Daviesbacteria bacterium GW2011_GWB1_41_5]|uniref:Uncharacterized protein n=1 Tax=Candidatus Daviesbacteria bacterium GW2011_GWB1_41_5 TaxID=1618429 RepID=A0A0G0ZJM1_9BACT|nr:MAG: hypothetical protein UU67_C0031G0011 [Candidatus Daviesbacteria bacterium GW2011_GWB1_41_5]
MWGYTNMMNWGGGGGFNILGGLFGLVILIDAILLGVWLWKQIQKK